MRFSKGQTFSARSARSGRSRGPSWSSPKALRNVRPLQACNVKLRFSAYLCILSGILLLTRAGVLRKDSSAMSGASSTFDPRNFQWMASLPAVLEEKRVFRARSLRERSLLQGVFLPSNKREVVHGNLECCRLNIEALSTMLKMMADNACIFVPRVTLLQAVCLEFHSHAGFPNADTLATTAFADGWGFKRMLNFLKRKWRRNERPRESRLNDSYIFKKGFSDVAMEP